jgi:hypothetical protein
VAISIRTRVGHAPRHGHRHPSIWLRLDRDLGSPDESHESHTHFTSCLVPGRQCDRRRRSMSRRLINRFEAAALHLGGCRQLTGRSPKPHSVPRIGQHSDLRAGRWRSLCEVARLDRHREGGGDRKCEHFYIIPSHSYAGPWLRISPFGCRFSKLGIPC